jgi:hypothetical protein
VSTYYTEEMSVVDRLEACTSDDDVDKVLVEIEKLEGEEKVKCMTALENINGADFINSKLRRKIKRLLEGKTKQVSSDESKPEMDVGRLDAFLKADFPSVVNTFMQAANEEELMAAINGVNTNELSNSDKQTMRGCCQAALNPSGSGYGDISLTRKARRRLSRLLFTVSTEEERRIDAASAAAAKPRVDIIAEAAKARRTMAPASDQTSSSNKSENNNSSSAFKPNSLCTKALEDGVTQLIQATSADDIMKIIDMMSIPTASYSSVDDVDKAKNKDKDTIQTVLDLLIGIQSNETLVGPSKNKRRIARFITRLQENQNGSEHTLEEKTDRALSASASELTPTSEPTSEPVEHIPYQRPDNAKKIPYIVFVGQLAYSTNQEDIEDFLREKGIVGEIKVRLQSDKKTGLSKGMAFVELEGPREMNKTIALHRSILGGRRINIERSCGGRNKEGRAKRLRDGRTQQNYTEGEKADREERKKHKITKVIE